MEMIAYRRLQLKTEKQGPPKTKISYCRAVYLTGCFQIYGTFLLWAKEPINAL